MSIIMATAEKVQIEIVMTMCSMLLTTYETLGSFLRFTRRLSDR